MPIEKILLLAGMALAAIALAAPVTAEADWRVMASTLAVKGVGTSI